MADKAVLSAAYNESVINGRQFELISVVQDSDADAFVNSVIMGLAADVSFSGILSDTTFPENSSIPAGVIPPLSWETCAVEL